MQDIWKDIEGYDGLYQVNSLGDVRSFSPWKNGANLHPGKDGNGYKQVNLTKNKEHKSVHVHRLVAEAFIPNPMNLATVNHIDGDKRNNTIANLEWCSQRDNLKHALRIGLRTPPKGKDHFMAKRVLQYTKDGTLVKLWYSASDIERELGFRVSNIVNCCNRKPKYKTSNGYVWRYEDDLFLKDDAQKSNSRKVNQYDAANNFIKQWDVMGQAAKEIGTTKTNIYKCCQGKLKSTGGYRWEYAE